MPDEPRITDDDLAAFVSGEVPTIDDVRHRLAVRSHVADDSVLSRAMDWTKERSRLAMSWVREQADYAERVELEVIYELGDMNQVDTDAMMFWTYAAGARAGAEEIERQARLHGYKGPLTLPPDPPQPAIDAYHRDADPRREEAE